MCSLIEQWPLDLKRNTSVRKMLLSTCASVCVCVCEIHIMVIHLNQMFWYFLPVLQWIKIAHSPWWTSLEHHWHREWTRQTCKEKFPFHSFRDSLKHFWLELTGQSEVVPSDFNQLVWALSPKSYLISYYWTAWLTIESSEICSGQSRRHSAAILFHSLASFPHWWLLARS